MAQSSGNRPIVSPAQSFTTTLEVKFKVSLADPLFSDRFEESRLWQQLNNRDGFGSFSFLQLQQPFMLVLISEYITEARIKAARCCYNAFLSMRRNPFEVSLSGLYSSTCLCRYKSISTEYLKVHISWCKDRTGLHPKTLSIRHR